MHTTFRLRHGYQTGRYTSQGHHARHPSLSRCEAKKFTFAILSKKSTCRNLCAPHQTLTHLLLDYPNWTIYLSSVSRSSAVTKGSKKPTQRSNPTKFYYSVSVTTWHDRRLLQADKILYSTSQLQVYLRVARI